jgi:hypothetical protein
LRFNLWPYASHDPFFARQSLSAYFLPSRKHSVALGVFQFVEQGLQASALVGVFDLH